MKALLFAAMMLFQFETFANSESEAASHCEGAYGDNRSNILVASASLEACIKQCIPGFRAQAAKDIRGPGIEQMIRGACENTCRTQLGLTKI